MAKNQEELQALGQELDQLTRRLMELDKDELRLVLGGDGIGPDFGAGIAQNGIDDKIRRGYQDDPSGPWA